MTGDIGITEIVLGVVGAVVLALLSFSLELYRRILSAFQVVSSWARWRLDWAR